jgi:N-acetylneuraminic acid mutarotase
MEVQFSLRFASDLAIDEDDMVKDNAIKRRTVFGLTLCALALVACEESATEPGAMTATPGDAATAASGTWIKRTNLWNEERWGHTSAVVRGADRRFTLYVIGGSSAGFPQPSGPTSQALSRVQAYDVAGNSWSPRKSLPMDLYKTNGAGVIKGKIYVSGGRRSGDKRYEQVLLVYDPTTNTWARRRDMPFASWGGVTGVIDNRLYVLTCAEEEDCSEHSKLLLYRYDPSTDEWTFLSITPVPLGRAMGGVIGGKLYATGGPSGTLVAYDPATNSWSTKASLPRKRWSGAGVAFEGKLYVLGGFEQHADGTRQPVRTTSIYNPGTNTWMTGTPMPSDRFDFAASRVVVNGEPRIQVVGGRRPGNNLQYMP